MNTYREAQDMTTKSRKPLTSDVFLDWVEKISDKDDISYNSPDSIEGDVFLLAPNGDTIDCSDFDTHSEFVDSVMELVTKTHDKDAYTWSGYILDYLTDKLGYMTVNTGRGYGDDRCKIVFGKKPTPAQTKVLRDWLSMYVVDNNVTLKLYSLRDNRDVDGNEYSADDIIKIINKASITGKFMESVKTELEAYEPKKTGKAYKVFRVKNGKLYPPMVANKDNKDTPIGVWLDAEEGEFAGLSKTGRPQVKSTGSGNLAYRPGWHLGDVPRAKQFDRLNKETGEYEFPKDFVWAECDYAMDVDYQKDADARGYERTKIDDEGNVVTYKSDKYQHSLAGLNRLPSKGYYRYRTNPNPDTVPWVITGQMKVNRLLSDAEVNDILKSKGIALIHRQGGDKTLAELGLKESLSESLLTEKKRSELINKSKNADNYAMSNQGKGRNRWERRKYSRIANSVRDYDSINMDAFWKGDILEFDVKVHGETDDYVVTVTFEDILRNLREEVKSNKDKLEFKCVLRSLLRSFNNDDVYISCTCLHPSTKIKLLDGTTPTVEQMKQRFDAGEKMNVFSVDKKGTFVAGDVEKVWVTKITNDFIKITLDTGDEILTTPEHPYMRFDGKYVLACDLAIGDELKSIGETKRVVRKQKIGMPQTPVYDIKVKTHQNFTIDAGVVLHNCPDWKYRFGYQATVGRYNSGLSELRPSEITNPNDTKGAGCKHSLLVLANTDWMMKIASVINNYIKYCRDNMSLNYANYIFPKIYGMPYNKAVQLSIFDDVDDESSGLLPSDRKTLKNVIDVGMKGKDDKGRFVKGNEYRFSKRQQTPPERTQEDENPLNLKFDNKRGPRLIGPEMEETNDDSDIEQ